MNIITIDGIVLPHPSSLSVNMSDLDSPDTTRNEKGYLQRDRVRSGLYKIELEFNAKTGTDIQKIENAIKKAKMSVTFPDSSGMITKQMYVGDRVKDVALYNGGIPSATRWNLKFNLVEY